MKIPDRVEYFFIMRLATASFILTPFLVFFHECMHFAVINAIGMKAAFCSFSQVGIAGFDFTASGISKAIVFYNSDPAKIALEAISAPIFTLVTAMVFLILYRLEQDEMFWCAAFTPLCLRMIGVFTLLPRIIEKQDIPNDEVIFAHFLKLPVVPTVLVSLILGLVCICMICMILERGKRLGFCVSSLVGGSAGYFIFERIVGMVLLR